MHLTINGILKWLPGGSWELFEARLNQFILLTFSFSYKHRSITL